MSNVNSFMYSHSKVIDEQITPEIIGIIKGNRNGKCLSQQLGKVVVGDCPPNLDDYTDKYFFRFKDNLLMTYDREKCLSYNKDGTTSFTLRSDFEAGQTNCMKMSVGNNYRLESNKHCITFGSDNCDKDYFKLELSLQ